MSNKRLPDVELNPAGFTPSYGWPFKPGKNVRKRSAGAQLLVYICFALMLAGVVAILVDTFQHTR
jgi:hypothetical protein